MQPRISLISSHDLAKGNFSVFNCRFCGRLHTDEEAADPHLKEKVVSANSMSVISVFSSLGWHLLSGG